MEENERFKDPKMQRLYEALCDLYPDRVQWQDIGEDGELIALIIDIKDNFQDGTKIQDVVWLNQNHIEILPNHLPDQDTDDYIVFAFEN